MLDFLAQVVMELEPQRADFGLTLLLFGVLFILKEFVLKKPEVENAKPDGLGDFKFPTATENRPRAIIFGTVKIEGPKCYLVRRSPTNCYYAKS